MRSRLYAVCMFILFLALPGHAGAEEGQEKAVEFGYDKGFYVQTPGGTQQLKLYGYLHGQWHMSFLDGELDSNEFQVRRGRLFVAGKIAKPLAFKVHVDFAAPRPLLDYYLDYEPVSAFGVRLGQFKTPLSRQRLVAAPKRQFIDDSIVTSAFKLDRDIGLMFHGAPGRGIFEYQAGIFNGSGSNARQDNLDLLYMARLVVNPLGPVELAEADFKGTSKPRLSIGAAAAYNVVELAGATFTDPLVATDRLTVAGEVSFTFRGLFTTSEVFWRLDHPQNGGDNRMSLGAFVQAGYMLFAPYLELAVRGSMVRNDLGVAAADQWEAGSVFNFYIVGQQLKLQLAYTALIDEVPQEHVQLEHRLGLRIQVKF